MIALAQDAVSVVWSRDGSLPSSETVYNGQQVREALAGRQMPHQIHMDVVKSSRQDFELC